MGMKAWRREAQAIQREGGVSREAAEARLREASAKPTALDKIARSPITPIALGLIPGVGPLAAAGIGGGLRGLSGGGAEDILRGAATYGAADYALGQAGNALRGGAAGAAGGAPGGGGVGGFLGRAGRFALDNPELLAAGYSAYQGARAGGRAEDLLGRAGASLGAPQREDLSGVFGNPSNPYGRAPVNAAQQAARASLAGR